MNPSSHLTQKEHLSSGSMELLHLVPRRKPKTDTLLQGSANWSFQAKARLQPLFVFLKGKKEDTRGYMWPTQTKIFTIWSFVEKVCRPLLSSNCTEKWALTLARLPTLLLCRHHNLRVFFSVYCIIMFSLVYVEV